MSTSAIPVSSNSSVPMTSLPEPISAGPVSLYYHGQNDDDWSWPRSYKKIGTFTDYSELWGAFKRMTEPQFIGGMFFLMVDPYLPVWEHKDHMYGGTYCINIKETSAFETFQVYAAAMGERLVTKTDANRIVGLSISPKKGFHIMKIWNADAKHSNVNDIHLYAPDMKASDIRFRANTDQRF